MPSGCQSRAGLRVARGFWLRKPREGERPKQNLPTREKAKTLNGQFDSRTGSAAAGASTKENPRPSLSDRLCRTRAVSQRQLPTDHDYAVSTRGYQLDQSSPLPATAHLDRSLRIKEGLSRSETRMGYGGPKRPMQPPQIMDGQKMNRGLLPRNEGVHRYCT
jgi:hypothetical protein